MSPSYRWVDYWCWESIHCTHVDDSYAHAYNSIRSPWNLEHAQIGDHQEMFRQRPEPRATLNLLKQHLTELKSETPLRFCPPELAWTEQSRQVLHYLCLSSCFVIRDGRTQVRSWELFTYFLINRVAYLSGPADRANWNFQCPSRHHFRVPKQTNKPNFIINSSKLFYSAFQFNDLSLFDCWVSQK